MPSLLKSVMIWVALAAATSIASPQNPLMEAAVASCAPAASAMFTCSGNTAKSYNNIVDAAVGAVNAASCICNNVFGPNADIISLSQGCITALVSLQSTELSQATTTFFNIFRMVVGAVPNYNLNINQAISGISKITQSCSDFTGTIRNLPSTYTNTSRTIASSKLAVEVVNNTQMVFEVNGKQVVPLHPDAGKPLSNGSGVLVHSGYVIGAAAVAIAAGFLAL
ncbi:hypothetical protein BC829DRAFT_406089 [Chytridium lagenaria]|nr:hypothetical protein BC829DRAFT_406089 [Chytridium lagenaria]